MVGRTFGLHVARGRKNFGELGPFHVETRVLNRVAFSALFFVHVVEVHAVTRAHRSQNFPRIFPFS